MMERKIFECLRYMKYFKTHDMHFINLPKPSNYLSKVAFNH